MWVTHLEQRLVMPSRGTPLWSYTRVQLLRLAYVANQTSGDVSIYTIESNTGTLSPAGTIAAGTDPVSVTVDPSGRFVYVANQINNVFMYTIDAATGALSSIGTIPGGIEPMSVAVHPSGKFAYVGDVVSDDVLIYSVDATTGTLTWAGTAAAC